MAQHGYLGDDYGTGYDPNWDDDRDDRERGREWRAERSQEWRGERERGAMFGRDRDWRDRDQYRNREDDRGVFQRAGNQARSWFRDEDDDRRSQSWRSSDAGEWFGGNRDDWERAPRNFSSNREDHYRSWRDKQMQALDRDYEDYCREREQQFHQDFDSWRQNRKQGSMPAARFTGESSSTDAPNEPQATVDPDSAAALGTGTEPGTGRRKS